MLRQSRRADRDVLCLDACNSRGLALYPLIANGYILQKAAQESLLLFYYLEQARAEDVGQPRERAALLQSEAGKIATSWEAEQVIKLLVKPWPALVLPS